MVETMVLVLPSKHRGALRALPSSSIQTYFDVDDHVGDELLLKTEMLLLEMMAIVEMLKMEMMLVEMVIVL